MGIGKAQAVLLEKRAENSICSSNPLTKGLHSSSLRQSINAFCYWCLGGEVHTPTKGTIVNEIRNCTSRSCPLHNVRPYR